MLRPMRAEDVPEVERLTALAFDDLDRRTLPRAAPEPQPRSPEQSALWRRRMEHVLRTDPGGCWVAEDDAGLAGVSAALRRELTWVLATFVVRPDVQGRGIGRQLFEAALEHGRGCLRGMISAMADPRAAHAYRAAGFALHPFMGLAGRVDRTALPVLDRVREGTPGDRDLMDSVDRRARDAAHGVDHDLLLQLYRLVVVDRSTGSGYAYVHHGGGPYLLAATNRRTATDLLWETLAAAPADRVCRVGHVTAANQWALEVGMAAGLELSTGGYLALRHMKPPAPYLPSGHFL